MPLKFSRLSLQARIDHDLETGIVLRAASRIFNVELLASDVHSQQLARVVVIHTTAATLPTGMDLPMSWDTIHLIWDITVVTAIIHVAGRESFPSELVIGDVAQKGAHTTILQRTLTVFDVVLHVQGRL